MKPRPKFRRTVRSDDARLHYYDLGSQRWVIYRRAGGVTRKTSLRGSLLNFALAKAARMMAERLKA